MKAPAFSPSLFCDTLLKTGGYQTPPEARRRPLPSVVATPVFYARMFAEVYFRGWLDACKPDFYEKHWASLSHRVWRLCATLGGVYDVSGFTGLPPTAVYVSNHASQLETFLLPGLLLPFGGLTVVIKEEITRYPFFGRVARESHCIAIGRTNPLADLRKVLFDGEATLRNQRSVLIFPQGKRLTLFAPDSFNTIGTKLAQRANVPIVPIAVKTDFCPVGKLHRELSPILPRRTIRIRCGTPIPPTGSPKDIHAHCIAHITSTLREWESLDGVPLIK